MNIQEATPAEIKGVLEQFAVFNDTKVEVKQAGSMQAEPAPAPAEPKRKRKQRYCFNGLVPHDVIMHNAGMKVNISDFRVAAICCGVMPLRAKSGSCRWYIPKDKVDAVVQQLKKQYQEE